MASINIGGAGGRATSTASKFFKSSSQAYKSKGLAAQRYKKLLLVCKDSKLTRF